MQKTESKIPRWQQKVLQLLDEPPDDRSIHWIYDPIGNSGQTEFVTYLACERDAVSLAYGHYTDVLNLASSMANQNIYAWNLTGIKPANVSELDLYPALDSVKDGLFLDLKYEPKMVMMNPPHVIVMANHLPKIEYISIDRWKLWEIKDSDLIKHIPSII